MTESSPQNFDYRFSHGCYVTKITKRDWCGVTERVKALFNQEAPMRKGMQKKSQITQIHRTALPHFSLQCIAAPECVDSWHCGSWLGMGYHHWTSFKWTSISLHDILDNKYTVFCFITSSECAESVSKVYRSTWDSKVWCPKCLRLWHNSQQHSRKCK